MRDATTGTTAGEGQSGSRMLECDKTLADIRTFLESLPAGKRARLRVAGPAGGLCAEIAGRLGKDLEQANALSVINYFRSQLSESEQ
ncbi:MAG TPA: hypothetical protein VF472_19490 [Burkholderiaceae bacterium]